MSAFSKDRPFLSRLKQRVALTRAGSSKETHHIVLDLKGSNLEYKVGDCIGLWPENSPELVQKTLQACHLSGEEQVNDERRGDTLSLRRFLHERANLSKASKKLAKALLKRLKEKHAHKDLEKLFESDGLKSALSQHFVWDFLVHYPEVSWEAQEFINGLQPMIPRFYSIASSQSAVGEEVHLTVGKVEYILGGHVRHGTATHFLCSLAEVGDADVPLYVQSTKDFVLPEDPQTPIIMVGPGTGIAPFVAFMQEREQSPLAKRNWLFFGECHQASDFYYEDYWRALEARGCLRLDLAFSRDQQHKIYVQHRMQEHAKDLWQWILDGAVIYVCGDAKRMAKDVEATLRSIAQSQGHMSEDEAKSYIKGLRKEKRYLRDVY